MTKNDGGFAFPRPVTECNTGHPGMTLRDWFAGQAMAAAYAGCVGARPDEGQTWAEMVSRECYEISDAMLAARRGPQ